MDERIKIHWRYTENTSVQDGIVVLMENSSVSNQISQLDLESQSKPTGFMWTSIRWKNRIQSTYSSIHPSRISKEVRIGQDRMKSSYERLLLEIYSGGVSIDVTANVMSSCCLALLYQIYTQNLEKNLHGAGIDYIKYICKTLREKPSWSQHRLVSANVRAFPSMALCNSSFWTVAFYTQQPLY